MATQTWTSGSCTCTLTDAGVFTVSGNGPMADYNHPSNVPWYSRQASIKSVIINKGVTKVSNSCFYYCNSLTSITIPNSVTSIGNSCFYHCNSLTSITIPNSVTSLDDYCFQFCTSLTSITIPDSITSLGTSCFYSCSRLSSITIPNSVTSIGNYCFKSCSSLTSVVFKGNSPTLGTTPFSGDSFTAHYYYSREDGWPASVRTSTYGGATSVTWKRMLFVSAGSNAVRNITIGSTNIKKVYAGSSLVWQRV